MHGRSISSNTLAVLSNSGCSCGGKVFAYDATGRWFESPWGKKISVRKGSTGFLYFYDSLHTFNIVASVRTLFIFLDPLPESLQAADIAILLQRCDNVAVQHFNLALQRSSNFAATRVYCMGQENKYYCS